VAVIVVTGYQDRSHKERARKEEVSVYLVKPVRRADLETALARIVQAI
jgi:YesN/AraC family two-component response regulator